MLEYVGDSPSFVRKVPAAAGKCLKATLCWLRIRNVTRNYAVLISHDVQMPDHFVDWTQTILNWVTFSRAARDAAMEGLRAPAEKFPTFAFGRQGRGPVALLGFRRQFHLTKPRDVAQENHRHTGTDLRDESLGL
jgi:hypothetical protein